MKQNGSRAKLLLLAIAINLAFPTPTQANEPPPSCRSAIEAADLEIADLMTLHKNDEALAKEMEAQRNAALKQLEEAAAPLPWYLWTGIGLIAGGAIAWKLK